MRLLAFLLLTQTFLVAQDLQHSLDQQYRGKFFLIRDFYQDGHLHFAQDGTLTSNGHQGSWTTAGIDVKKVKLGRDFLELSGQRVVQVGDKSGLRAIRIGSFISIRIDEPTLDEQAVRASLSKIFIDPKLLLADVVPEYWRSILRPDPNKKLLGPTDKAKKQKPCTSPSLESPCYVGGDVTPPKPISMPDPEYSELARQNKYQGTTVLWLVVDETGAPQRLQIARVLGFGLDDQAVEAVRTWRFQPATQNGKPVPVQINVEVNFRLQ